MGICIARKSLYYDINRMINSCLINNDLSYSIIEKKYLESNLHMNTKNVNHKITKI